MIGRWVICLFFFPQFAFAEAVSLQLGEQDDYTRLVLTLPEPQGWSVQEVVGGIDIQVPLATDFLTNTLPELSNSRIADVVEGPSPDTLRVMFNCDCSISSYLLGNQFLTIDISGEVTPSTPAPTFDLTANLVQPWHAPLTQSSTRSPTVPDRSTPQDIGETTTLETLDTAVSTGIASATYQGLLDIPVEGIDALSDVPEISTEILNNINVGIQSQLSTLDSNETALPSVVAFSCKKVSARLTEAWAINHSFSIERGKIHSQLITSETAQEPDTDAQVDLAILFVGQGLGYEALALLSELNVQSDLTKALAYMAQVIDSPTQPELIGLEFCPEDLAYWAFLHSAGTNETVDKLDPRNLMLTFKLLPAPLQNRTVERFGDALARAGHASFQAELQDFKNTFLAISFADSSASAPRVDFESPATPRDILRADLTDRDLDPTAATPRDPTRLELELLDSLRVERRATSAEPALLDAVLERHVADGRYLTVLTLLEEASPRLAPADYDRMLTTHLSDSITAMTEPELLAFAFRSDLPVLPTALSNIVAGRLSDIGVQVPSRFLTSSNSEARAPTTPEANAALPFSLPNLVMAPEQAMPTFAESEELISGSAAMRNVIETLINDNRQ